MAVVYALIISRTVYRDMKLSELPQVFVEASVSTATIMMMVGLSKASSYVVVTSGLPQQLLDVFTSITSNRIVILLLLNLLFLIIGMLMEANAAIITVSYTHLAAATPRLEQFFQEFAHTELSASGLDVGLPAGQMGNSEVGHTNIGAGRVVFQDVYKRQVPRWAMMFLMPLCPPAEPVGRTRSLPTGRDTSS